MIEYGQTAYNQAAGKAHGEGLPVMVMEPLLGGKLATALPQAAVSHFKRANPDLSPVAWAFRWIWNQPEVTLLLSGMNDIKHLEENLQIAESASPDMLLPEELETFQGVKKIFNDSYKIHCTGCHY
jgi:predicted aldo/keto reductase-like oxidoreductase